MHTIRSCIAGLLCLFLLTAIHIPAKAADFLPQTELNRAEEYALARFCAAETEGEPFICRLSVAAVMLNRMEDPRFPDTVTGILSDGGYKASPVTESDMASARWALQVAQMGVDPTGGALWWAWSDTADAADLTPHLTVGRWVFGVRG